MMLVGKNVELKAIDEADYPLLSDWFNQPDFWGNFFNIWPQTVESVKHMFAEYKESGWYIIVDRASKDKMGIVGYFRPYVESFYQGYEFGYLVHQDHRGKRVATQAARLLVNHLFDATPVERLLATVVVGNVASVKVLENAGLIHEGVERRKVFLHGVYQDTHQLSIIRSDWGSEGAYRKSHEF